MNPGMTYEISAHRLAGLIADSPQGKEKMQ